MVYVTNNSRPSIRLRQGRPNHKSSTDYKKIILAIVIICASFHSGAISGKKTLSLRECPEKYIDSFVKESTEDKPDLDQEKINKLLNEKIKKEYEKRKNKSKIKNTKKKHEASTLRKDNLRIAGELKNLFAGMVKTSKEELMINLDIGVPRDHTEDGKEDALIFYSTMPSFLSDSDIQRKARHTTGPTPFVNFTEATENCDAMNLAFIRNSQNSRSQCLVIYENYESHIIQKWQRRKGRKENPLEPVMRGLNLDSASSALPNKKGVMKHFQTMVSYLDIFENILKRLRPIVESIAQNNTVIVMVVNSGQSELLMNFACSSKAQGFSLDNLLLFSTDEVTHKIVLGLGITSFYDEEIFKNVPEEESRRYASETFAAIMYAKVVSVQLVNYLGFDVLYQDVDIVWLKNPMELFHNQDSPLMKFDILFQDDGARSVRYAPYSANSGFYYVRHNKRTRYLLISVLYQGDFIHTTGSHQEVLAALLLEQSSTYGLRVKVLDGYIAPGGFHYHMKNDFMKRIVQKREDPYLFHMSWTANKDNKLKFMKQMGWWYISDQCLNELSDLTNLSSCCVSKPEVVCYYSDKPSAIPCKDSPTIDRVGMSFW